MRFSAALIVLAALALALAGAAEASVLRAFTLSELRTRADTIVTGRVVGVRSVEVDGTIETVARVRVLQQWRGEPGRTIRVRVPGGQTSDRRLLVPGAPAFERGEELLLFLYADGRQWRPVGLFQGVWRLDPERPQVAHASTAGGAALIRPIDAVGAFAVDRPERPVAQLVGGGR